MKERQVYLIVTAGGHGARMGSATPKQFLEIGGKAILHRTMERFIEACPDIRIITVLPEEWTETWKRYCLSHNFIYPQTIVAGGFTRYHSVRNAMAKVPDGAIVAVHDGVRPLVSAGLIRSMVSRMGNIRALVPVMPCTDTLKAAVAVRTPDGNTEIIPQPEQIDRSRVYCAQTPQMFLSEDIKKAYTQAYRTSFTDDASVAEAIKIPLVYCEGERFNIKITTPEDLVIAEVFLKL